MGINEIVTVGVLQQMLEPLLSELKEHRAIANKAADRMLTIDEAAEFVQHSRKTVRKWIDEGKFDRKGKLVKLPAREFSPGFVRISVNDLLHYGEIGCYELVKS